MKKIIWIFILFMPFLVKAATFNYQIDAELLKTLIFDIVIVLWIIISIIVLIYFYLKYDKEIKSNFTEKYYRDFPSKLSPAVVGYLFNKQVGPKELSASIINLVNDKIIDIKRISDNDYQLNYVAKKKKLSDEEIRLIDFVFGVKKQIKLSDLKQEGKKEGNDYLRKYYRWQTEVRKIISQNEFFEKSPNVLGYYLFCFIGILIGGYAINTSIYLLGILNIIISITLFVYISNSQRRTEKGSLEYAKWKALRNFLNDFSNIDKRELPELVLWNKYLVYAIVLGCADKLSKTMEVKINDFDDKTKDFKILADKDFKILNKNFISSIDMAVADLKNAKGLKLSKSDKINMNNDHFDNSSSGGGFGGGFSSGGGSFGGGSGGSRF